MKEQNYELTIKAAFLGYVVQAIVNNFLPLLFIQMQKEFGIPGINESFKCRCDSRLPAL